jgi:hypothetical protein
MQHRTKVRRAQRRNLAIRNRKREAPGDADIVPDVLLPIQLAAPPRSPTLPVQRLMLAVLEEAVATYQRQLVPRSARGARELEEVQCWIESEDASWPFSCTTICHVLGLDVTRLRDELQRWRETPTRADGEAARGGRNLTSSFRHVAGSRSRVTVPRPARPDVGRRVGARGR